MVTVKAIDAATWAALDEIDIVEGDDLIPELTDDTYRLIRSDVASVVVPALVAGSIDQATPTIGDTLTVTGSNETASGTYQWQQSADGSTGWTNISGATSASIDTTTGVTDDYYVRRGVTDGVQGPVYTTGVQVSAASAGLTDPTDLGAKLYSWADFTDTSTLWQDDAGTVAATSLSDPVHRVDDKSSNGHDWNTTVVSSPGNGIVISGGMDFNAAGFRFAATPAAMTDTMEIYALIDPDGDTSWALFGENADNNLYGGVATNGNAGAPDAQVSGLTHSVNGVDQVSPTQDTLYDAVIAAGPGYVVQSARNINLDTNLAFDQNLMMLARSNSSGERLHGNVKHFVVTTALTTQERDDLVTWLMAQA